LSLLTSGQRAVARRSGATIRASRRPDQEEPALPLDDDPLDDEPLDDEPLDDDPLVVELVEAELAGAEPLDAEPVDEAELGAAFAAARESVR